MNNLSKEDAIKKLLEYKNILQEAYDKEKKKIELSVEIREHKENIENTEKLLEKFLEDKEKNVNAIAKNAKTYRRNVFIHYILYALFSFSLVAAIADFILDDLLKIDPNIIPVASTLIAFIIFMMMSLTTNFKIQTEEKTDWKEKTLYVKEYREGNAISSLGTALLILYVIGSAFLYFVILEKLSEDYSRYVKISEFREAFLLGVGKSTLIIFPIFLALLFILTSSKRRFGDYKKGWENAEKVVRESVTKNIAYKQEGLSTFETELQNLNQEYDELINQPLYIEAVNFLPEIGVWQAPSYEKSIKRLNNLTMVIYYMYKNYVDTYGEALRYLETVSYQNELSKAQEELRRETERAKWKAEEARREASEAKYQADKARLEADNARFRAQQAKAQADQAKFQADQARYRSW